MKRSKITQVRNEITKAIGRLAECAREYSCGEELLERFGCYITVDFDVMEDEFRRVEVSCVDVSKEEKSYPNIEDYVFCELGKKLEEMNSENENDYLETLSVKERREYHSWLSA